MTPQSANPMTIPVMSAQKVVDTIGVVLPAAEPNWRVVFEVAVPFLSLLAAGAAAYAAWQAAEAAQASLKFSEALRSHRTDSSKAAIRSLCRTIRDALLMFPQELLTHEQLTQRRWFDQEAVQSVLSLSRDVSPRVTVVANKASRPLRLLLLTVGSAQSCNAGQGWQPSPTQTSDWKEASSEALALLNEIIALCAPSAD